jgi:hypothetical protein
LNFLQYDANLVGGSQLGNLPRESERGNRMSNAEDIGLIRALMGRVEALEDERAIHDTLVRYGFAVDSDDADATASLYSEDCEIDIDAVAIMKGREGARGIVTSPGHQAILPRCAHIIGPFVISLDGERATATGYQTVFVTEGRTNVWRQSYGRWGLQKRRGRWEIVRRLSRRVGHPEAQQVLAGGL